MVLSLRPGGRFEILKEENIKYFKEVNKTWRYMGEDSWGYLLKNRTLGVQVDQSIQGASDVEVEDSFSEQAQSIKYQYRYKTFVWYFHKGKEEYAIRYEIKVNFWCIAGKYDDSLAEAMLNEAIAKSAFIGGVKYLGSADKSLLERAWGRTSTETGYEFEQSFKYSSGGSMGTGTSALDEAEFRRAYWKLDSAKGGLINEGELYNNHQYV